MIKFRAWDKTDEKMISWEQMRSEFTFEYFEDENLVFMQNLGVLPNHQEFHEHDIVESTWWDMDNKPYRKRGIIIFNKGMFVIDDGTVGDDYNGQSIDSAVDLEVIGNVYENRDLLEDL